MVWFLPRLVRINVTVNTSDYHVTTQVSGSCYYPGVRVMWQSGVCKRESLPGLQCPGYLDGLFHRPLYIAACMHPLQKIPIIKIIHRRHSQKDITYNRYADSKGFFPHFWPGYTKMYPIKSRFSGVRLHQAHDVRQVPVWLLITITEICFSNETHRLDWWMDVERCAHVLRWWWGNLSDNDATVKLVLASHWIPTFGTCDF